MKYSITENLAHWLEEGFRSALNWDWRHYCFYFGVPIVLTLYATLNNWELLRLVGFSATASFYFSHATIPYWTTCILTWLFMHLFRSVRPNQISILCMGVVASSIVMLPILEWLSNRFFENWGISQQYSSLLSLDLGNLITGVLPYIGRAILLWVAINLFFDRVLRLPRYRYDDAITKIDTPAAEARAAATGEPAPIFPTPDEPGLTSPDAPAGPCRFLERLPISVGRDEVLSIGAEQHYIRIHTAAKDHIVLYRFSDAVAELGSSFGMQVHRSHWVRYDAIANLRSNSKKMKLNLRDGTAVPVSGPYQQLVRKFAREEHIPVLPLTFA
jgi:hypothetical protein